MSDLEKYINQYKGSYKFYHETIIWELVNEVQKYIDFAFKIENHEKNIIPRLILAEDPNDQDSNLTKTYIRPALYISLEKRNPFSADPSNMNKTFVHNNLISGVPRYSKVVQGETNDIKYEYSTMNYDNQFKMVLITKTVKEQMKIINILERALSVYSSFLRNGPIIACGITSIASDCKKLKNETVKTTITFQMRTRELLKIDKNYIIEGYKIYSHEYETGSGELKNEEWIKYPKEEKYKEFN